MLGLLLHVLIGYSAQPAGIQVVFYLATLLGIGSLMRVMGRVPPNAPSRPAAAAPVKAEPSSASGSAVTSLGFMSDGDANALH